jgi:acetyltransferase-like isoleucine patch superfamily enzyme
MNAKRIIKGIKHPISAYYYFKSLLGGLYYRIIYTCSRKRIFIGRNFRVRGRLSIKGPGSVSIGDNVLIDGTHHAVTPWTYSKDAKISIGNNVFLNGTRFGCKVEVEVGDNCILADCRILDTDHHSTIPSKRNDQTAIKSAPIKIGKNVWVAMDSVVLKGVKIGHNSTITAKSVVMNDVPANCIYGGNPAIILRTLTDDEMKENA